MFVFKRILNLLKKDERERGVKVAVALFFTTLLDFVSLASLLPVLYWLLKGGQNSKAALFFSILAVTLIIVKGSVNILFFYYCRFSKQNSYIYRPQ